MRLGIIAFAFGCWLCQQQAQLISSDWLWAGLPALALIFLPRIFPKLLAALVMGFLYANAYGLYMASQPFSSDWERQTLRITGAVASLPQVDEQGASFLFHVEQLQWHEHVYSWQGKVRLRWRDDSRHERPVLRAGDRWQLSVRLQRPHGNANPGSFDAEAWMFAQGIKATGSVTAAEQARVLPEVDHRFALHRVRQAVFDRLQQTLPDSVSKGLLVALAMGDRSLMTAEHWRVLMATGTNHLMAISGLHIGLLAGLAFWLARWLWSRSAALCLRLPAPKAAAWAAMLAATLYALLAGFAVPTQRAWVMTMVVMWALCFFRPLAKSQVLCLALLAVLCWDPLAVLSAGFWLSFAAVTLIVYVLAHRWRGYSRWQQWGRIQWALGVALLPLTLLFFQQSSLLAPLANWVAVPWVSVLVVPALLIGCGVMFIWPWLATWIFALVSGAMDWLWLLLQWLASWPLAVWQHAIAAPWVLLAAMLGVALLLAPRGWPGRVLGLVFLLPLVALAPNQLAEGEADFYLLDVGQGLAAVVRTQQHWLVFDAGARISDELDLGQSVVGPFLRTLAATRIDALLVSHGDNDHIGGVEFLRRQWPVKRLLTSVPQRLPGSEPCHVGQHWQWDGVDFEMLHPHDGQLLRSENDQSCVLRVRSAGGSVLLAGDIELRAEQQLLERDADRLQADILVAPHHGSKTSSSAEFVAAVQPEYVLYAVGYHNRFGHPSPQVMARYRAQGSQALRSDVDGNIGFQLRQTGIGEPQLYRQQYRRYWHWQ
ncbi:MAG: DNA internalization-related competence protein ComEC/Rec2 [Gammaproteobacteria bacterium]|nr:DNA internalization-related competence protein ComEC/Rec2 [Gammaproteobacteria bacterium]